MPFAAGAVENVGVIFGASMSRVRMPPAIRPIAMPPSAKFARCSCAFSSSFVSQLLVVLGVAQLTMLIVGTVGERSVSYTYRIAVVPASAAVVMFVRHMSALWAPYRAAAGTTLESATDTLEPISADLAADALLRVLDAASFGAARRDA